MAIYMNPVRAIVFDAFGTLIRYTTRPAPYECLLRSDEQPVDRQACLTRDVPMATLAIESGVGDRLDLMQAHLAQHPTAPTKPHQTMYRLACAELRCAPADALFVGDSKRCDFEGPKAFGMQARWLD